MSQKLSRYNFINYLTVSDCKTSMNIFSIWSSVFILYNIISLGYIDLKLLGIMSDHFWCIDFIFKYFEFMI